MCGGQWASENEMMILTGALLAQAEPTTLRTGIRVGALAGLLASGLMNEASCTTEPSGPTIWWEGTPCRDSGPQKILGWSSVAAFTGSTGYDIWDAGRAPERVARRQATLSLSVHPRGVQVSGQF